MVFIEGGSYSYMDGIQEQVGGLKNYMRVSIPFHECLGEECLDECLGEE